MTKHIVVGYDGSVQSAAAVAWAADEASLRGAALDIVSCYAFPSTSTAALGWVATEELGALMAAADAHATTARASAVARHPELQVTTRVMMGPASAELMHGRSADDLIVVGASSHHGAGAFWLGSTPRDLVRHSPCPVAVIRGVVAGAPTRVVVGYDGSASSQAALEWAGEQAGRYGVELVIVHAWTYPYTEVAFASMPTRDLMQVDAALVLDRAVEQARERFGADVSGQLVEHGAAPGLLATVCDGDLLVLGSRGHGAFIAGLLGSTVNTVLDRAEGPVVVVRSPDDQG
jgi:nucleotide-binding universal stress UspA family protein